MSVCSALYIRLAGDDLSALSVLQALRQAGWSMLLEDQITLLPLGDHDDFAWKSLPGDKLAQAEQEIEAKCQLDELVGVVLTWHDTSCGGEFLIYPNGDITFSLSIYRQVLDGTRVTDVSWYLSRLIKAFESASFQIESWNWKEHY